MMAAQAVQAQQTAPGERIEVTGSRIPLQTSVDSPSPIAIISAEDIKIEGVRNVENLLNNMPQVFADQGGNYSNGASGTANVNLRGLGADRTLVLVNGKRLPPGSPQLYAADLNQIPAPLIQRIEVLTGGASAVYGSDAVAGVVNFIMKSNFEGVQVDANYGYYMHKQDNDLARRAVQASAARNPTQYKLPGDVSRVGETTETSLLIGGNFAGGKGNATVFFGYKDEKPILQADYDYSACALSATATGYSCLGSGTSFPGRFLLLSGSNAGRSFTVANAQGGVRPYVGAEDSFNYGPYNYFQRPSERYTANMSTHYDVTRNMRVYGTFNFHDDSTLAQIAPSGLFGGTETVPSIFLRGDNPLLSAAWRNTLGLTTAPTSEAELLIFRRNIEGGGRADDLRHTSYRTVVGVKGDVLKNWDYDLFMQTGKVLMQETYRNDFSATRVARALDVVTDPTTGNPVCRARLDGTDANCVPWNIFSLGGVTPEALAYLQTPGLSRGSTEQKIQGATISGDLGNYGWKLPGAKSGIGVAAGVERRVEKLNFEVDTAFATGDLAGQGGATPPTSGQYTVKEVFAEARVPILDGRNMALSVTGSVRHSDYDLGFKSDTYGTGIEFSPIQPVKLRASYQRAIRAPNIIELFLPQSLGLFDLSNDPCAGPTPSATAAQCARTGVTAAQYGSEVLTSPAGQYNTISGGNPQLQPEKANSYTFGIVLTPTRNLSATIDYFKIDMEEVIDNIDPSIILNQCLTSGQFCDLIQRDRLGSLWASPTGFIRASNINLGKRKTSGVDVNVSYNQPIGRWGGLNLNLIGTYLKELIEEPIPGLGSYDCAGLYEADACSAPVNPEWRHKFRVTWSTPWNLDLAMTWRHFNKVEYAGTSSNPLLSADVAEPDRVLGERNYLDLAFSWAATKQITVQGGINNLLDKDPPLSGLVGAGAGNGNTFPQIYDALGRKIFIGATVKF